MQKQTAMREFRLWEIEREMLFESGATGGNRNGDPSPGAWQLPVGRSHPATQTPAKVCRSLCPCPSGSRERPDRATETLTPGHPNRETQREDKGCRERPRGTLKQRKRDIQTETHREHTEWWGQKEREMQREAPRYVEGAQHSYPNTLGSSNLCRWNLLQQPRALYKERGIFREERKWFSLKKEWINNAVVVRLWVLLLIH